MIHPCMNLRPWAVEKPAKFFLGAPNKIRLQAGIFDNAPNPPAAAINFAATELPTNEERLGAMKIILLCTYSKICREIASKYKLLMK